MLKEILEGRFIKHPLHPMLVHFPVGLWVGSLVFDILFFVTGRIAFATVSYYCIAGGIVGALLAAPAGMADYLTIPSNTLPKRLATAHLLLNLAVTILFLINFFNRHGLRYDVPSNVTVPEFLLSIVSVGILGVSGYLGGLLVYEHGIGFRPQARGQRPRSIRRAA